MDNNEFENQAGSAAGANAMPEPPRTAGPDYLAAAKAASEAGDATLGLHLYMAAYETAMQHAAQPGPEALSALRAAWDLAISLKERSIAEYIFEKIEPYLSAREMGDFADALQRLAIDRLEQFGISREDLEDMADALSDDFFGGPLGEPNIHIEQFTIPAGARPLDGGIGAGGASAATGTIQPTGAAGSSASDASVPEGLEAGADALIGVDGLGGEASLREAAEGAADAVDASIADAAAIAASGESADGVASASATGADRAQPAKAASGQAPAANVAASAPDAANAPEKYDDLAGFASVIEDMRALGIGVKDDPEFDKFVERLGALYGIDGTRAETILFKCSAREDANRFLEATVHELSLPVVRMSLEESVQGNSMLVMSSEGFDARGRQNFMRFGFTRPAILALGDIDAWPVADFELPDERNMTSAQMGAVRAMHDAMNLIRSAAANPEVYVLASAASVDDIDPALVDAIYPASVAEIELPTEAERRDIWERLKAKHPTLSRVSTDDLVRLSAGMPRYDIAQAVREAIDDAYRRSLTTRSYQPVTAQNIFEKIAAYQPLDSAQYNELEDKVIEDFRRDLAHLNDILDEGR